MKVLREAVQNFGNDAQVMRVAVRVAYVVSYARPSDLEELLHRRGARDWLSREALARTVPEPILDNLSSILPTLESMYIE